MKHEYKFRETTNFNIRIEHSKTFIVQELLIDKELIQVYRI